MDFSRFPSIPSAMPLPVACLQSPDQSCSRRVPSPRLSPDSNSPAAAAHLAVRREEATRGDVRRGEEEGMKVARGSGEESTGNAQAPYPDLFPGTNPKRPPTHLDRIPRAAVSLPGVSSAQAKGELAELRLPGVSSAQPKGELAGLRLPGGEGLPNLVSGPDSPRSSLPANLFSGPSSPGSSPPTVANGRCCQGAAPAQDAPASPSAEAHRRGKSCAQSKGGLARLRLLGDVLASPVSLLGPLSERVLPQAYREIPSLSPQGSTLEQDPSASPSVEASSPPGKGRGAFLEGDADHTGQLTGPSPSSEAGSGRGPLKGGLTVPFPSPEACLAEDRPTGKFRGVLLSPEVHSQKSPEPADELRPIPSLQPPTVLAALASRPTGTPAAGAAAGLEGVEPESCLRKGRQSSPLHQLARSVTEPDRTQPVQSKNQPQGSAQPQSPTQPLSLPPTQIEAQQTLMEAGSAQQKLSLVQTSARLPDALTQEKERDQPLLLTLKRHMPETDGQQQLPQVRGPRHQPLLLPSPIRRSQQLQQQQHRARQTHLLSQPQRRHWSASSEALLKSPRDRRPTLRPTTLPRWCLPMVAQSMSSLSRSKARLTARASPSHVFMPYHDASLVFPVPEGANSLVLPTGKGANSQVPLSVPEIDTLGVPDTVSAPDALGATDALGTLDGQGAPDAMGAPGAEGAPEPVGAPEPPGALEPLSTPGALVAPDAAGATQGTFTPRSHERCALQASSTPGPADTPGVPRAEGVVPTEGTQGALQCALQLASAPNPQTAGVRQGEAALPTEDEPKASREEGEGKGMGQSDCDEGNAADAPLASVMPGHRIPVASPAAAAPDLELTSGLRAITPGLQAPGVTQSVVTAGQQTPGAPPSMLTAGTATPGAAHSALTPGTDKANESQSSGGKRRRKGPSWKRESEEEFSEHSLRRSKRMRDAAGEAGPVTGGDGHRNAGAGAGGSEGPPAAPLARGGVISEARAGVGVTVGPSSRRKMRRLSHAVRATK